MTQVEEAVMLGLEELEHIAVILGLLGGLFHFAVLRPLYNAITKFELAIEELRGDIRRNEERWHVLSVKLAELDQRAKSAHHRIDEFVKVYETSHNVKIPHPRDKEATKEDGK
ncbi:MAG: hypothetical protein J6M62_06425 [Selenomonadaceae bacterium]|nr:hypothetical protein [Selenomonadaceae bacterium]MBP3722372.1 hypothetical protein [Selenomonadaceae bacterium]